MFIVGFYFIDWVFDDLKEKGILIFEVILYVGVGIFKLVLVEVLVDYYMYEESIYINFVILNMLIVYLE